jgi:hypothetical protein
MDNVEFKVIMLSIFILTTGILNDMLSMYDNAYGTDNSIPVFGIIAIWAFLALGVFWDEIKEEFL